MAPDRSGAPVQHPLEPGNAARTSVRPALLIALLMAVVTGPALWALTLNARTDLSAHARFLQRVLEARVAPESILFYFSVALVTGFTTDFAAIARGFGLVLGVALGARYLASIRLMRGWPPAFRTPTIPELLALAGVTFVFCLPIPGERWLHPHIPPNYWHNSTSIFVMPFVVLLFAAAMDFAARPSGRGAVVLTLLMAANVLSKPSFVLCFVVAFPLFLLIRATPLRAWAWAVLPFVVAGSLVGAQYLYIFRLPSYQAFLDVEPTRIGLGWFHVWSRYVHGDPAFVIPLAILNSLALPLGVAIAYPSRFMTDKAIQFCLMLLVAGTGIYAILYEDGPRMMHGNFGWQPTMCNYLLHACALGLFVRLKRERPRWTRRDVVLAGLFAVEIAVGIFYLARLVAFGHGAV